MTLPWCVNACGSSALTLTPTGTPLVLDGRQLALVSLELDGEPLATDCYQVNADQLTLLYPPESL